MYYNTNSEFVSEEAIFITEFLGCECENWSGNFEVFEILNRYDELIKEGKHEGFIPLIIVATETLAQQCRIFWDEAVEEDSRNLEQIRRDLIETAKSLDVQELFDELQEYEEDFDESVWEIEDALEWKQAVPVDNRAASIKNQLLYMLMNPGSELIIAKIPAVNPWELPVWVPMGGFNECPNPETQAAIFRYWNEKYHAVPAIVGCDNWVLFVENPPVTIDDALRLVKEQYLFDYETLSFPLESEEIFQKAVELSAGKVWEFWWD